MVKETKSTIMVATISAIVIALITTYGTIAVSAPKVKEVQEDLQKIDNIQLIKNLPIGTILASMLKPTEFAKAVGDPNRTKNNWVLADGRDITISQYGQLSGKSNTPDLRGVFLRGTNVNGGQDPEPNRTAGHYQPDALQQHGHLTDAHTLPAGWKDRDTSELGYTSRGGADFGTASVKEVVKFTVVPRTAVETRPKNVAVYFYIKIN